MRATIRKNPLALHADVNAAMPLLEIDDQATYYEMRIIKRRGRASVITEEVMPGTAVRHLVRQLLLAALREVEQTDPAEISLRRSTRNWLTSYRTVSCTYSKVC